jgi:hypothetical protein
MDRESGPRREFGRVPQDRQLLVDQADVKIAFQDLGHGRARATAVRAVVVEELDHGDHTVTVTANRGCRVVEQAFPGLLQG